ncbi:Dihydroorotate dehydrogenase B (NAD(+)), electron transfer subunit [Micromonospora sp. MW-13]|uniref:iron-sulfur cluster-binding protein n=2 Tax=unclassified Micromonospora TaxID=2617518 RepID=UPI000EE481AE|nr:hypothetical protein [Micromonospora sp. MW-13]RGC69192.1 Dihydroorotate dehydrogenase B (NAD(+)), electron transfer subunit [Micromonospora sp. MW-13]
MLNTAGHLVPLDLPPTHRPRPTWHHAPVLRHEPVGDRYRLLRLHAPTIATRAQAGQFVMLTAARTDEVGPVLPRPMAIYDVVPETGTLDVVYGVLGGGTRKLSTFAVGETMLVTGPLGQGFHLTAGSNHVLLLGRGIGTCSLTMVAAANTARGGVTTAVVSARHPGALVGVDVLRRGGTGQLHQVTDQDATSEPDFLATLLTATLDNNPPELILTCGSQRLVDLAAELGRRWGAEVQVSVEAHMACGLGYCHGCSSGQRGEGREAPLVCLDGPVFWWNVGHG